MSRLIRRTASPAARRPPRLGRALFFDTRLSANGKVACATCHSPEHDSRTGAARPRGRLDGAPHDADRRRRAAPWFFWDGRKDSLWSQALGPLESPVEHGGNRAHYAHAGAPLPRRYERSSGRCRTSAGCRATRRRSATGRAARMGRDDRARAATREPCRSPTSARRSPPTRRASATGRRASTATSRPVARRAGAGDADATRSPACGCSSARRTASTATTDRSSPNNEFHNTGVPPEPAAPDQGRAPAVAQAAARRVQLPRPLQRRAGRRNARSCRFVAARRGALRGAFKMPSLRNVARARRTCTRGSSRRSAKCSPLRPGAACAPVGHSELHPLGLSDEQVAALVAFLGTLDSPGSGPAELPSRRRAPPAARRSAPRAGRRAPRGRRSRGGGARAAGAAAGSADPPPSRCAYRSSFWPGRRILADGELAADQPFERLVHRAERVEGVQALGAELELAGRLRAAQHEHGEHRDLGAVERRAPRRTGAGT